MDSWRRTPWFDVPGTRSLSAFPEFNLCRSARSLSDSGVRKRNGGRASTNFNDFDTHIGNM